VVYTAVENNCAACFRGASDRWLERYGKLKRGTENCSP